MLEDLSEVLEHRREVGDVDIGEKVVVVRRFGNVSKGLENVCEAFEKVGGKCLRREEAGRGGIGRCCRRKGAMKWKIITRGLRIDRWGVI